MTQLRTPQTWNVSLHGKVLARLTLPPQFGGNVDLAMEAARVASHTGEWTSVKDQSVVLTVEDEAALRDVNFVSCRPVGHHDWRVVLEAQINVRTTVVVEAPTAHQAVRQAELEELPTAWHVFSTDGGIGASVQIETLEIVEEISPTNVLPL